MLLIYNRGRFGIEANVQAATSIGDAAVLLSPRTNSGLYRQ